ncbi:MAG: hypothetical protein HC923_00445 [Myxococcales bacterium]|nr:hypothetical protein [Myxococcales bacterium]
MHEAAAWELGLRITYLALCAEERERFARMVDALKTIGARGANVTMPYKEAAHGLADRHTREALEIGCVNTLRFEGPVVGHNTDGPGFARILASLPPERTSRIQVIGAGGAARAVVWAAARSGAEVTVCAARHTEGSQRASAFARMD